MSNPIQMDLGALRAVQNPRLRTLLQAFYERITELELRAAELEALHADEDWHYVGDEGEPAFVNSWGNNSPAGYTLTSFRKTSSGIVYVRGAVDSGSSGTNIFTLPKGYRPLLDIRFACATTFGNTGTINIHKNGDVRIDGTGATTITFLDGVVFQAGENL